MSKLPKRFTDFMDAYPDVGSAYTSLGKAVMTAGPLERKTAELVKVGVSIAAGLEGGTHSHVRKALDAGATPEEIRHVAVLTLTTIGFPAMMKGVSWVDDILSGA